MNVLIIAWLVFSAHNFVVAWQTAPRDSDNGIKDLLAGLIMGAVCIVSGPLVIVSVLLRRR